MEGFWIDPNSKAAYWTGFVMGQINKNMEAHQVVKILYAAFQMAIEEAQKEKSA